MSRATTTSKTQQTWLTGLLAYTAVTSTLVNTLSVWIAYDWLKDRRERQQLNREIRARLDHDEPPLPHNRRSVHPTNP